MIIAYSVLHVSLDIYRLASNMHLWNKVVQHLLENSLKEIPLQSG